MACGAPAAICLDPFRAIRRGLRQGQIEDRQRLSRASAPANRDNLLITVEIDALDCDLDAEDQRLEEYRQIPVYHREPTRDLLGLAVSVDGGLFNHLTGFEPATYTSRT